jgi:hypothetical protein
MKLSCPLACFAMANFTQTEISSSMVLHVRSNASFQSRFRPLLLAKAFSRGVLLPSEIQAVIRDRGFAMGAPQ